MKWFLNMKIGPKLILGFLIVAILTAVMGIFALVNTKLISDSDTQLYENMLVPTKIISQISENFQRQRVQIRQAILTDDPSEIDAQLNKMEELRQQTDELEAQFEATILSDKMQELFDAFQESKQKFRPIMDEVIALVKSGDKAEAIVMLADDGEAGKAAFAEMEAIGKVLQQKVVDGEKKAADNTTQANNVMMITIISMSVVLVLSVFIGLIISRGISKPIKKMVSAAEKLAVGDTNVEIEIKSKDEVGTLAKSFESVIKAIRNLITDTDKLTQSALVGNLSARADVILHDGDYRKVVEGINQTLDAITDPINEVTQVLAMVADGNLKETVKGNYRGDHAILKDALNDTINSIKGYIDEISMVLGDISNGNLCVGITSEYKGDFIELKNSINTIVSSLNEILKDISIAAEQVAMGTGQVSESSQTISQGATEQASSIEELTVTITQIAAQTKQNAINANKANDLSITAKDGALEGNVQMKEMQKAMADINDSASNISKIIKVIDDIAFQTNILALNAAVEAARAGIHGKGFAVVAEEVRNLAAKCADAAKETTEMIEGSIKKTEAGSKLANSTADALAGIVEGVEKTVLLVGQIAAASNEQATGISQVNNGIEQLSQVVQTNSATAEEAAASSEELSGQADILREMVGRFQLNSGAALEIEHKGIQQEKLSFKKPMQNSNQTLSLSDAEYGKY